MHVGAHRQVHLGGPMGAPTGPIRLDDLTSVRRQDPNTDPVNLHAADWLVKRQQQFQTMFKLLKSWFGGGQENARWGVSTPRVPLPPILPRDPPPMPPPQTQPPPRRTPYQRDSFEPAPAPAG